MADIKEKLSKILNGNAGDYVGNSTSYQNTETYATTSPNVYSSYRSTSPNNLPLKTSKSRGVLFTNDKYNNTPLKTECNTGRKFYPKSNIASPIKTNSTNENFKLNFPRLFTETETVSSKLSPDKIIKTNDFVSSFTGLKLDFQQMKRTKHFNETAKTFSENQNNFFIKNHVQKSSEEKTKIKFDSSVGFNKKNEISENRFSNFSQNVPKVRKEIDYLSRVFSKDKKDFSLINRPFITLESKPELDFSPRNYLANSPTNFRKNYLISPMLNVKQNPKKEPNRATNLMTLNFKSTIDNQKGNNNNLEIEDYIKDFELKKKKIPSNAKNFLLKRNLEGRSKLY